MLAQEFLAIPEEGGCAGVYVDVAAPSHAFVALRTVGGKGDEVAERAPPDVVPKAVDQGIATLEMGGEAWHAAYHGALDTVRGQGRGQACDFQIAVAVLCETRFQEARLAVADEEVLRQSSTDVLQHHGTRIGLVGRQVGVEYLGKAQAHFRSLGQGRQMNAWHAGHVLSHVIDVDTGAHLGHAFCGELCIGLYGALCLQHLLCGIVVNLGCGSAAFGRQMSLEGDFLCGCPFCLLPACIGNLSHH